MNRSALDKLLAATGLVVAAVLLVASGLLFWANSFVTHEVRTQLSAQQIFFPPKGSPALADPKIKPYLEKYAGQQLTNGEQARAYADHFIAVHVAGIGGGKTYAQLSSAALANPADSVLAGKVQSAFRGETLRGLLLDAYAFGKMGQIALWAAVSAVIAGLGMLVLAGLGLVHANRAAAAAPSASPVKRVTPAGSAPFTELAVK